MPLTLLAPGNCKRIGRLIARLAEEIVAAQLKQCIEDFRRAAVSVVARENVDLGLAAAKAIESMGEHACDLASRWPLARRGQ